MTSYQDKLTRDGLQVGVEMRPHDLRHIKARVLFASGADLVDVQAILGHRHITTTQQVYAPYNDSRARRTFKKYSLSAAEVLGQGEDRPLLT